MDTQTHKSGAPHGQSGQLILEEAARLFRQCRFSHTHGAYAEGQSVAVAVDPRWNADEETFRVLISCLVLGHRRVEWARLPVQITPVNDRSGVLALARLDAQGRTLVPSLPPGEYRLSLRLTSARAVPVLSAQPERLAAQGEEEVEDRQVWSGASDDGHILWSLEATEEGEVQLAFETKDERLAGNFLIYYLIDPVNKQVRHHQQLQLAPTRTAGKWEAFCSLGSRAEFAGPYELDFAVALPEED
ncbi:MAG: hypothetical protein HYZ50_24205 [Deltaproteobacteria bacterium]|nr:hypothetical protein [Deltaproteobacteria bacterium]